MPSSPLLPIRSGSGNLSSFFPDRVAARSGRASSKTHIRNNSSQEGPTRPEYKSNDSAEPVDDNGDKTTDKNTGRGDDSKQSLQSKSGDDSSYSIAQKSKDDQDGRLDNGRRPQDKGEKSLKLSDPDLTSSTHAPSDKRRRPSHVTKKHFKVTYDPEIEKSKTGRAPQGKKIVYRMNGEGIDKVSDPRKQLSDYPHVKCSLEYRKREVAHKLPVPQFKTDENTVMPKLPRQILVSELSPLATESIVSMFFRAFGDFEELEFVLDPSTGAPLGLCKIKYREHRHDPQLAHNAALKAVKEGNGSSIAMKPVHVELDRDGTKARRLTDIYLQKREAETQAKIAQAAARAAQAAASRPPTPQSNGRPTTEPPLNFHKDRPSYDNNKPAINHGQSPLQSPFSDEYGNRSRNDNKKISSPAHPPPPKSWLHADKFGDDPYIFISSKFVPTDRVFVSDMKKYLRDYRWIRLFSDKKGFYVVFDSPQEAKECFRDSDGHRIFDYRIRMKLCLDPSRYNGASRSTFAPPAEERRPPPDILTRATRTIVNQLREMMEKDVKERLVVPTIYDTLGNEKAKADALQHQLQQQKEQEQAKRSPVLKEGEEAVPTVRGEGGEVPSTEVEIERVDSPSNSQIVGEQQTNKPLYLGKIPTIPRFKKKRLRTATYEDSGEDDTKDFDRRKPRKHRAIGKFIPSKGQVLDNEDDSSVLTPDLNDNSPKEHLKDHVDEVQPHGRRLSWTPSSSEDENDQLIKQIAHNKEDANEIKTNEAKKPPAIALDEDTVMKENDELLNDDKQKHEVEDTVMMEDNNVNTLIEESMKKPKAQKKKKASPKKKGKQKRQKTPEASVQADWTSSESEDDGDKGKVITSAESWAPTSGGPCIVGESDNIKEEYSEVFELKSIVRDAEDFDFLSQVLSTVEVTEPIKDIDRWAYKRRRMLELEIKLAEQQRQQDAKRGSPVSDKNAAILNEEFSRVNPTGSARTEGFFTIPEVEKGQFLPHRRKRLQVVSETQGRVAEELNNADSDSNNKKNGATPNNTSRVSRLKNRRLAADMNAELQMLGSESEVMKFNQLKARKKPVKFARSSIHNWGLYAMEPIAKNEMIIEYVGEMVRQQVADLREKQYLRSGIGSSYLFRIDEHTVVDATKKGGIARFINHCCTPSCTAKIIKVDGKKRIVIYALRNIAANEELTYDYKFEREIGSSERIPCLCGSVGCKGFLN